MPKLKLETIRERHAKAKAAVEMVEKTLSEIAAEGSRLEGIYLCTSHPSGTSYGGNREQQSQRVRWQLTRKDGSSYPKGTLSYEEALEQCEHGKRYVATYKQLDKAYAELVKWEKKLVALDIATTSSASYRENAIGQGQDSVRQVA